MPKFINHFEKPAYFEQALFLYAQFTKYLDDDYALDGRTIYDYFETLIEKTYPFFYLIIENDEVAGIVYLENIIGNSEEYHSAELSTCFNKKYWGDFTKICSILFMNFCFENIGFKKIKVLVYPDNFRTKSLLEFAGFKKEAYLQNETLRNGKLQDVEIYSATSPKIIKKTFKKGGNYEN